MGLRDAAPSLKLGAPGGELKEKYSPDSYSWALLTHIVHGKHYFTGKTGARVDFLSMHKKVGTTFDIGSHPDDNLDYETNVVIVLAGCA